MKIINTGNEKGWSITKTCKYCKTVLEADGEDIYYELRDEDVSSQQYNEEIEGTYYINCPSCEVEIKVKNKEIPTNIKEFLRSR